DEVVGASAADTMGLEVGDAITHVNGKAVSDIEALASILSGMHAGDTVKIKVKRGDATKTVEGKLGALDDGAPEQASAEADAPAIADASNARPVVGIEVREFGDVLEISEVFVGSAAERAGLAVGDKLVALGGQTVERLEDIGSVLDARVPGDQLRAEILRGSNAMKIELTLGAQ
ncbi:MAG: PDZ domain-containing protein, partial [Planctomycetota bacterium]